MSADDFALAWLELRAALPRGNVVRLMWRRKTHQWACTVEGVTATGTTEADAMRGVASSLRRRAAR